jgi:hypothetical protein
VRGLKTKEEKGKCLKKAGMIGFLGQVMLRTHREIAFQETVRSKLHPRRYTTISHALIAKSSPIFPNRFALPSTKTYPRCSIRFNAYHRFPSFPPSERTSLPRQAQDIPACTADFVAARSRIGRTRHDSRGPSRAN